MKKTELSKIINIPTSTLTDWEKTESKRHLVYELLQSFTKEELEKRIEAIKLLKGLK